MIGPLELLFAGLLAVPMLVMATIALWMLARMVHVQDRSDPAAAESLASMRQGLEKLESRLSDLEEVMLDPETAVVKRHN